MYFAVSTINKREYLKRFNKWKNQLNRGIEPKFHYKDISIYCDRECGKGNCSAFNIDPLGEYEERIINQCIDEICMRDFGLTLADIRWEYDPVKIFLTPKDIENLLSHLSENCLICFDEICDEQIVRSNLNDQSNERFLRYFRMISCLHCLKRYQKVGTSVYVSWE